MCEIKVSRIESAVISASGRGEKRVRIIDSVSNLTTQATGEAGATKEKEGVAQSLQHS